MNVLRAGKNWLHVGGRAAVYGSISIAAGTITRRRAVGQWCMRSWCKGSLDGLGIQRSIVHAERLDPSRTCVYVANHLSQLDILVIGSYLPGDYRWLAKSSLFKIPFLGWHLALSGHVPVYRGEQRERNAALSDRIHAVVQQGASILFFPEGTRSHDGHLQRFHLGAFLAAVREELPVVPLVVRGTHELLVKGAKDLAVQVGHSCSVTVLPAIEPPAGHDETQRASALCAIAHDAFVQELGVEA